MPRYKIVASDLDGTLLNSSVEVSEENLKAIREMTELGVHFVPSSGRTYTEIPDFIRNIPGTRYVIYADGAGVYDQTLQKRVLSVCMDRETVKIMLDIFYEYDTLLTVRIDGKGYVDAALHDWDTYGEYRLTGNYKEFIYEYDHPVENFREFCYGLPEMEMACTFFKSDAEMNECRERLKATGLFHVASSEPYNLEVFNIKAGKGNTLLRLAELLEIDPAETIGVGDSLNDTNNIEKAGLGLAMENACGFIKEIADQTICNNDEHAMKYILENFIK